MYKKGWILLGALILIVLSIVFLSFNVYKSRIQGQVIRTEEIVAKLSPYPEFKPPKFEEPELFITVIELSTHNTEDDCWIAYNNKVYDYSNAKNHPNMAQSFFSHCGQTEKFEEAAKAKHGSKSSESRVENYGNYIGDLTQ